MSETRRFDESVATQVVHRNEPGPITSALTASVSLVAVLVAVGLAWKIDGILKGNLPSADFVSLWVRVCIIAAALPFLVLAWGKLAYVRGKLESDLYRVTGWRVDLDGDGKTGPDGLAQDAPGLVTELPEREVIRVVPVRADNAQLEPLIRLPDKRALDAGKVRDFVIGAGVIGCGLTAWKARGWTRPEWETVRDLLALHNLADPRQDGKAGELKATPGQCMRAFGL
jgi:hypothetical protein